MLYKIKNLLIIFISLIFFASCVDNKNNFNIKEEKILNEIERKDHEYCISLGLDFGDDALKTEIYYRCRILLANYKIVDDATKPQDIRHNIAIKKYISNLINKFNESYENLNNFRNNLFDNIDHKKCEKMGYNLDSLEFDKVEKYMNCRNNLILQSQINPPYQKTKYLKYPQDSYNIGFVVNKKQDEDLKKFNEAKEKYPFCIKFNLKDPHFKECSKIFGEQEKCYEEAKKSRFVKEMEERAFCQKRLYVNFPDSMMKKDKEQEEIDRKKISADIYNNNNFYSIGIDQEMLKTFEGKKIDDKEKEKEEKIKFNSEEQMYTKTELTRLRQRFIKSCTEEIMPKIENFIEGKNQQCRSMTLIYEK